TQIPPGEKDMKIAKEAFELAKKIVKSGKYDIVILDEINVAMSLRLVKTEEVIDLIKEKPEHVELVLTGRYAPKEIIDIADLVTEMKEIKHPFQKGIPPRKGIEF
ncbi:cob(I)yrinic acid a,c-diamide adenosyltransferase, partial [Candidatus Bathyarchaeota archaeon]|nr:cob(I)yrinic acid a,c-diamide adenosyltransferase [Candidatus Bathyarchaeota archaeon]